MKSFPYTAYLTTGKKKEAWQGTIRLIRLNPPVFEAEVEARGSSFHILFGRHAYGNYIVIPNWNIGTELSRLSDVFWNTERLRQYGGKISRVDVCSISYALSELGKYINL